MALIYEKKHHRNPSGLNNKVNWLLSESNHNRRKLRDVINKVMQENYQNHISIQSWITAYYLAYLKLGYKNA